MQGSYLGPEFSQLDIHYMARKHDAVYRIVENFDELCDIVADHIAAGKVIGWHQGRMEWGPRTLATAVSLVMQETATCRKN